MAALRRVERLVRDADEVVRGLAVLRIDRAAEAPAGRPVAAVGQGGGQAADRLLGLLPARCDEEERELVPADAERAVRRAQAVVQHRCEALERRVAGEVAVRVVDLLEAVEVAEDERETVPVAVRAVELALEL